MGQSPFLDVLVRPGFVWFWAYFFTSCLLLQYYAESHGVIYVIDSTDEERLSESKEAFGEQGALWPEL